MCVCVCVCVCVNFINSYNNLQKCTSKKIKFIRVGFALIWKTSLETYTNIRPKKSATTCMEMIRSRFWYI